MHDIFIIHAERAGAAITLRDNRVVDVNSKTARIIG